MSAPSERIPDDPNPYDPPQSDERPVRDLANTLGPLGTLVVALVALASGVIACGTSCYAIMFTGAALDKGVYGGLMIGFVAGAIVGLVLLVFVTRFVFRRLKASYNRPPTDA
ncbi:hypothetical protein Pla175_06860 [Pirellulimonas nuda]|uniref:Uncharacterized protein n=1 Tax=Pirellulimonas nuda TaxID=2528009 RepID=A0A518D775_9BACT|nr:hypothetical protein [Pirellulimonas nuda]QDU87327.1 hypothetical protein Pla175_06860 [Pirellulimonas nuda]